MPRKIGIRLFILTMVFTCSFSNADGGYYLVLLGTHRTIATIIQVKNGTLDPNTVVGTLDGRPLTSGKLVELYDEGKLGTANRKPGEPSAPPWFDITKADEINREFDVNKFFKPGRDFGIGIALVSRPSVEKPFTQLKSDSGGDGESVANYINANLTKRCLEGLKWFDKN